MGNGLLNESKISDLSKENTLENEEQKAAVTQATPYPITPKVLLSSGETEVK